MAWNLYKLGSLLGKREYLELAESMVNQIQDAVLNIRLPLRDGQNCYCILRRRSMKLGL